jgi:hypothetical protein
MWARLASALILIAFLSGSAAFGQAHAAGASAATNPPVIFLGPPSMADKVEATADWARRNGRPLGLDEGLSNRLGLRSAGAGVADSSGSESQGTITYFIVFRDPSVVLLQRRDLKMDRRVYWLLRNGRIPRILRGRNGTLEPLSGAPYDREGYAIVDSFYSRLPPGK